MEWAEWLRMGWTGAGLVLIALLCLAGVILSCLTISGTWLVSAAALLAMFLPIDTPPGIWTVIIFLVISGLVEAVEALAGAWGVTKRGGSRLAGAAALVGGLVGLVVGALIPPAILGSLAGAGSITVSLSP